MEGVFQSFRVIRVNFPGSPFPTSWQNFRKFWWMRFEELMRAKFGVHATRTIKHPGPLPRRTSLTFALSTRPPRGAGVPPRVRSFPLSLEPWILCCWLLIISLPLNIQTKNTKKHAHAYALEKPRTPACWKLKKYLETTLVNPSRSGSGWEEAI